MVVALSENEVDVVRRGALVRVGFGARHIFRDGARAESAFVGMVNGALKAYANVCMHHPTPLDSSDFEAPPVDDRTHLPIAPFTEDGARILCLTHGADFDPTDGRCTVGPCFGQSLVEIPVEALESGGIVLHL